MSSIAFIGQPEASNEAQMALDYLGRVLAHQDVDVALVPKGQSNIALMTGYNAKATQLSRAPVFDVDKGVLELSTDQVIVFGGEDLQAALDKASPDWRQPNNIILNNDQDLSAFLDLVLVKIKEQTGVIVEPL